MSQPTEIHALAGAYALDAVTDLERAEFARHLSGCDTCGLEVAGLLATAARLADATWAVAPPRLRDNVLRQASRTRQSRPGRPDDGARPGRWRRWAAAGVAAAVLAAGGTFAVQQQRLGRERQQAQQLRERVTRIQAVMAAPDARARQVRVDGGGQLTVVYSAEQDAAVVMCSGLATPEPTGAYQVWLMRDGSATGVGLLPAGQNSGTTLVSGVRAADAVAISREPAGGSAHPTRRAATVELTR